MTINTWPYNNTATTSSYGVQLDNYRQAYIQTYYTSVTTLYTVSTPKVNLEAVRREYELARAKHNKREMKRLEKLLVNNQQR